MSAETAKSSVGKPDLQCKLEKSPNTHSSPYVPRAVAAQGVSFSAHTLAQTKFGGGRSGWTVHVCRNSIQTATVVKVRPQSLASRIINFSFLSALYISLLVPGSWNSIFIAWQANSLELVHAKLPGGTMEPGKAGNQVGPQTLCVDVQTIGHIDQLHPCPWLHRQQKKGRGSACSGSHKRHLSNFCK